MDFHTHLKNNFPSELADNIIAAMDEDRTRALLLNTSKVNPREFNSRFPEITPHPLTENGFLYNRNTYDFGKMCWHDLGAYYIQEPSAMSVVSFLDIKPGELVLDMCAAPGGKTMQVSLLLQQSGIIIANDISHARALVLSSNVERLGLGNVVVINNDLTKIYESFLETFDKIILDAPCSGSGMFRKDDRMLKDWSYNKVIACQKTQTQLVHLAYLMLKPGGTIAYSTCSFSKEENEDVIASLLANSDAYLSPIAINTELYQSRYLEESVYFLPSLFVGEGHFLALIKKPGQKEASTFMIKSYRGRHLDLLKQYGLENRYNLEMNNSLYSLSQPFAINKLNVIRFGVRTFDEINKHPKPNHHLAIFLNNFQSIELNETSFKKYQAGEVLLDYRSPGYHIVSYQGINVGFVHSVNGTLKNLYPKGLRRR
ncbi:MAG: hypothetical protein WCX85_00955 [Bacilli bacterium]|jgi:NOL1/NOP2/sun family putative RNA methylase|nr:hypothetical protein [Bacilli bacterium]